MEDKRLREDRFTQLKSEGESGICGWKIEPSLARMEAEFRKLSDKDGNLTHERFNNLQFPEMADLQT